MYVLYVTMTGAIVGCGCSMHASLLNNKQCIVYQHRCTLLLCSAYFGMYAELSTDAKRSSSGICGSQARKIGSLCRERASATE